MMGCEEISGENEIERDNTLRSRDSGLSPGMPLGDRTPIRCQLVSAKQFSNPQHLPRTTNMGFFQ
jgi:hypothetical protein